jgi:hypothetical protein
VKFCEKRFGVILGEANGECSHRRDALFVGRHSRAASTSVSELAAFSAA